MWWVKENEDKSRGGFQNRDVGKKTFDEDFGPEYGVDYARFADPPDISRDLNLLQAIGEKIFRTYGERLASPELIVRNGFVILKGSVQDEKMRQEIEVLVHQFAGVKEVINQLKTLSH